MSARLLLCAGAILIAAPVVTRAQDADSTAVTPAPAVSANTDSSAAASQSSYLVPELEGAGYPSDGR